MAAMDWLRWYNGTVNDPKWRVVARRSGQRLTDVIAVWAAVVENANQASERGTLEGWDDEVVGAGIDMDPDAVRAIREAMQGLVLDGGRLTGWERRNPKREDNSTDRVRRYRERKRSEKRGETQCNAGATSGNKTERLEESREEKRVVSASDDAEAPPRRLRDQPADSAAPTPEGDPPDAGDAARAMAAFRAEAVSVIVEELWRSKRDRPPGRCGRGWSLPRELSIWNGLVEHDPPEDVLGAMRVMRRVGQFGEMEGLSLQLFQSRKPECRDLYQRCLQFHRKQVRHEESRDDVPVLRVSVGNVRR